VAAIESNRLLAQIELPRTPRTAQTLAPGIATLLSAVGWEPRQIQLVATTRGPGSFTGVRIELITARTLAYATGAPVMGLDTLEVIAAQSPPAEGRLHVVLDAHRQQLFAAPFTRDASGHWRPIEATSVVDHHTWIARLEQQARVTGPGLSQLISHLPSHVHVVSPDHWVPQAATVGRLAQDYCLQGRRDDVWQLMPDYGRRSAAEEKWQKKEGQRTKQE
jgi:tRNA threonylcarbamoyladenosine biosynthesis protein TsaB